MNTLSQNRAQFVRASRSAFSLIELLVVISIIALLIGILLPALGAARESAYGAVSLARAQQISLALHQYAMDNEQYYPATEHSGASWMERIAGYIDAEEGFRSPLDANPAWNLPDGDPDKRETSYAISAYFSPDHPPYFGVRFDDVALPSSTIIAAEITDEFEEDHFTPMFWGFDGGGADIVLGSGVNLASYPIPGGGAVDYEEDAEENWDPATSRPANLAFDRYRDRNVYGFTDGHAGLHEFRETFEWSGSGADKPSLDWYDPKTRSK